jgi:tetratricopeptide (TPR) repeat protein
MAQMVDIDAASGAARAASTRVLYTVSYSVSAALLAVFLAAVFGYARYGGPFVDRLDDQIGEIVAARATGLASAGLNEQAESVYRQALTQRFDDEPMQRIWTMQRYAKLLLARGKPGDAADLMEDAFRMNGAYGPSYTLLFDALRQADRLDRAIAVSEAYAGAMRAAGDANAEKWARYNVGAVCRDSGRLNPALDAFAASYAVVPSQENAWQAARLLHQLGRDTEAGPYLEYVVLHGDAQYASLARDMQQQVKPVHE